MYTHNVFRQECKHMFYLYENILVYIQSKTRLLSDLEVFLEAGTYSHSAQHLHGRWASEAFIIPIQINFRNISRCQWSSSHTSPLFIWYLADCLCSLIDPGGAPDSRHASLPSVSPNTLLLLLFLLGLIWCNYLIIPACVTHWPSLAFSSCSPCPSSPLTRHIFLTYIPVSPLWRSQFNSR